MSDPDDTRPATVDKAREQVEQTRAELADTVGSLTDKLDVKKQVKAKVNDARAKVAESATSVADRAGELADTAHEALPPHVRHSVDATRQVATPAVSTAVAAVKTHRRPALFAAGVGILAFVVLRRWRRA